MFSSFGASLLAHLSRRNSLLRCAGGGGGDGAQEREVQRMNSGMQIDNP
jgi:hypothetical protein